MLYASSVCEVNTVMASGTFARDSSRLRAVTTTVSSVVDSAAAAVVAASCPQAAPP